MISLNSTIICRRKKLTRRRNTLTKHDLFQEMHEEGAGQEKERPTLLTSTGSEPSAKSSQAELRAQQLPWRTVVRQARQTPKAHLLHQKADVVALDGAAVHGGAGVHSLHNCNRGRCEARPAPGSGGAPCAGRRPSSLSVMFSLTRKMVMKTDLCQEVMEGHTNAIHLDRAHAQVPRLQ